MRESRSATSEGIEKGSFVISLSGRDSGRVHIVISCDEPEYAYIADGGCRTVGKPKKKKYRHLRLLDLPPYSGALRDSAVAAAIGSADVPEKQRRRNSL